MQVFKWMDYSLRAFHWQVFSSTQEKKKKKIP